MTRKILPQSVPRVPQWPNEKLRPRTCPFCNEENEKLLERHDHLPLAHCGHCGLWYVNGLPPEESLQAVYKGYWHDIRPTRLDAREARRMREEAGWIRNNDVRVRKLEALSGGLKGKRVLELGCGTGGFLLALQFAGADVVGQDISPEACSYVSNELGLTVIEGSFFGGDGAGGGYDIVVMNDLLEHLVDPWTLLRAACSVLRSGGLLSIWTPNGGAAGTSTSTARHWMGFCVDLEHLQYCSIQTIVTIAKEQNLTLEHIEALGYPSVQAGGLGQAHGARIKQLVRDAVVLIPYGLTAVRKLRTLLAGFLGRVQDDRSGTYHLFAILRRTDVC